jgi:hypothetical protein
MTKTTPLLLVILSGAFSVLVSAAPKPNILLIVGDDMGYGDVGSPPQEYVSRVVMSVDPIVPPRVQA